MQDQSRRFETVRHVSRRETAQLIRARLRESFPGVRFSVRCSRGGGATDVRWADGPTQWQVQDAVSEYESEGFDGMTDSRYSTGAGELLANLDGTVERVRYSSGLILEHRDYSPTWRVKLEAEVAEFVGEPFDPNRSYPACSGGYTRTLGTGLSVDEHRGEYGATLVYQLAQGRDMTGRCDHEKTYPVGNGWHRCRHCGMRTRVAR